MKRNILGALLALVLVQAACCDEIAEKGRAVYTKYKAAVVTVRVVVAVTDGGDTSNSEGWANGAVLDSSGLTVVALSFLDPTGILDKLDDQGGPQPAVKIATLQMIQEDGTELPAENVSTATQELASPEASAAETSTAEPINGESDNTATSGEAALTENDTEQAPAAEEKAAA